MALLIGEQSSNGFQRAFWLHFSFFSIFVTVLILLFVYCERCQTLYMHLTNDHFVSQTTGEHFLWFVFFLFQRENRQKREKGEKKGGNLRYFRGIRCHFYDMPADKHQCTVTVGKETAILLWDCARGGSGRLHGEDFNSATIEQFILSALFFGERPVFPPRITFYLSIGHGKNRKRKAQRSLWVLVGLLR